ncbi:MAG: Trm112 family protein [Actinomycetia bacterium]|nr:Trm112 family protein [Actinomycetes bacterium]
MDPRLLAILACPKCNGTLRPVESENTLRCGDCGSSYLVNADGVPIMTFIDD